MSRSKQDMRFVAEIEIVCRRRPQRPAMKGSGIASPPPPPSAAADADQYVGQVVRYFLRPKRVVQRRSMSVKGRDSSAGVPGAGLRQTMVIQ